MSGLRWEADNLEDIYSSKVISFKCSSGEYLIVIVV